MTERADLPFHRPSQGDGRTGREGVCGGHGAAPANMAKGAAGRVSPGSVAYQPDEPFASLCLSSPSEKWGSVGWWWPPELSPSQDGCEEP